MPTMKPFRTAGACLVLALVACDQPTALEAPASPGYASVGPTLIECPTEQALSSSGQIGVTGGVVRLKAHALTLPMLAVVGPTSFELREPVSGYMELDLRGNGQESFGFAKPVSITIDYSRCTRSNIDKQRLAVWKIDPSTKALLKYMGGTDDKVARTITFVSDSLSSYSIANAPTSPDEPSDSTGTP